MTNKRTATEKVERLQELLKGCKRGFYRRNLAVSWLNIVQEYKSEDDFLVVHDRHKDEAQATWDVHTGVAFTKLYKALK